MLRTKARIHGDLGEKDEAHKILAELSDRDPGDAYCALDAGITGPDLEAKEKYIRRAVMAAPNDGICHYFLAWLLDQKGEFAEYRKALEKARNLLESVLRNRPRARSLIFYLANIYDQLDMPEKSAPLRQRYDELNIDKDSVEIDNSHLVGMNKPLMKL